MTYCRQGHTLVDNEAEGGWDKFPPGTFFEIVVSAVRYYGIVDEYSPPTPTTLVCRLYSDPARTILVTAGIPTGVPYELENFVDYLHDARDIELAQDQGMGVWRSPVVTIRDDTGVWGGQWIASPRPDGTVEFNFDGSHTLFKSSVEAPIITEQAGAGLGAGTYEYCIVPVDGSGRLGGSSRTLTITLAGPADILIDWLPNTQVTDWNVYGRQVGGSFGLMATLPGATVSYLDNGTDVPNPAFQPPLFEDPAWTPAVVNREQAGTDGDVVYDAEGLEDGSTKLDDGSTVSTFTADGAVSLTNTVEGTNFDLNNLVSHNATHENVIIDPGLFTQAAGPIEDEPPVVINYNYHVYIDDAGDTVLVQSDDFTGQTTTIVVNTVDNTFDITLSDSTGVLATDSLPIDPNFTIPAPGSLSSRITLSDFSVQADGTILGTEQIEANTYDVTPQSSPGVNVWMDHDFGSTNTQLNYSLDNAQSWITGDLGSRLIFPPGFTFNREAFIMAVGEGWTVVTGHDNQFFPSLVGDYSMHWTNDMTQNPWPFNDAAGRVASLNITPTEFNRIRQAWDTGDARGYATIKTMANGLGPFMHRNFDMEDLAAFFGMELIHDFFFPATGSFTFQAQPGAIKYRYMMYWREKNLCIGLNSANIAQIYSNPITTNPAAPLGAQSGLHHIIQGSPVFFNIVAMGTTKNVAWITWFHGNNRGYSISSDGSNWTDVIMNNVGDSNPATPGNEFYGMRPDEESDKDRSGVMRYVASGSIKFSTDDGATWQTKVKGAQDFDFIDLNRWNSNLPQRPNFVMDTPMLWNGINWAIPGPSTNWPPDTFARLDANLDDLVPSPGGAKIRLGGAAGDDVGFGSWIGASGSPNGIPGANLQRYLGRSVVIPLKAVNPPPPFVIRDPSKSAVYDSKRTEQYAFAGGSMRATITSGPGGLGSTTVQKYEDGQNIIINVPGDSDTINEARKPVPVNMQWTPFPRGTFE